MNTDSIPKEQTIWKKKIFRKDKDTTEKFSILENTKEDDRIEEKMKRICKRKQYKNNYKNIEEMHTIYEEKQKKPKTNSKEENRTRQTFGANPTCNGDDQSSKQSCPIKETFTFKTPDTRPEDAEIPSVDTPSSSDVYSGFKQIFEWIIYILFFPNIVDYSLTYISRGIASFGLKKKGSAKHVRSIFTVEENRIPDTKTIKNILSTLFYLPLIVLAVYNWTFMVVFRDNDYCIGDDKTQKCYPANADKRFRGKSGIHFGDSDSIFVKILDFLFGFCISPLNIIDQLLFENTPDFKYLYKGLTDGDVGNSLLRKVIVSFGLPYILYDWLNSIFSSEKNDKEGDPFYAIMLLSFAFFATTAFRRIITHFFPQVSMFFDISGLCVFILTIHVVFKCIYYSKKASFYIIEHAVPFVQPLGFLVFLLLFLVYLVLIVCLMIASSAVSIYIVTAYLMFHSLFGIIYFGGGFSPLLQNIRKIYYLSIEKKNKMRIGRL